MLVEASIPLAINIPDGSLPPGPPGPPGPQGEPGPPGPPGPPAAPLALSSLSFRDFSPCNDGSQPVDAEWVALINAARTYKVSRIHVPRGQYRFTSKPATFSEFPVDIFGDGSLFNGTKLIRDYSASGAEGFLQFMPEADGSHVRNLCIVATAPSSGGAAISWRSTATAAFTNMVLEDLYITSLGTNNWQHAIHADGSAKVAGAIGQRLCSIRNVHCFGTLGATVYFKSVEGLHWFGGGLYPAGGTSALSGSIVLVGTPEVSVNNVALHLETFRGITLSRVNGARIHGISIGDVNGYTVEDDSYVYNVQFYGKRTGLLRGNWDAATCAAYP